MSADDAWEDLKAVLEHYAPPCSGLHLFTADSRTDDQRDACAVICGRCRIRDLCNHYAVASRVDHGFWAGIDRAGRGRGRPRTSTTDAGAVSPALITQKEEPS
ncbi:WhiB family transcriptional regulator [Microbacterium sp. M28]|uniref:WhiB family transcriptional regulator n=1 Tax=Microbacterium sp. M28 TaxID=2962064 RepID=UPI0021F4A4A0|nr:WhiB family transcriptional regulator [Microbacterium sp. M28]UYO96057.1 WhiB family transcriptional regulator [Microbacterium sp. M28]